MGSTGSGSFSDYTNEQKNKTPEVGESGGSSGEDQCAKGFSTGLEDVETFDFFLNNNTVPPVGTVLSIELRGRILAVDSNGISVGALPTKFNYLAACLKSGFTYQGAVRISSMSPIPRGEADFVASQ